MPVRSWDRRSPRYDERRTSTLCEADLDSPVDVTLTRRALRDRSISAPLPAGPSFDDVERLLLAFEELASNGLRHGRPPVHVRVLACPEAWIIEVTDAAPLAPPLPDAQRDPAEGGVGLFLVASLSAQHGWTVDDGRKLVWASIEPGAEASAVH